MTWKELKHKLEGFTPEQLEMEVQVWGEYTPLSGGILGVTKEPHYFDNDWDSCYPESEIETTDFESPTIRCVAKKGVPYIWFD